MICALTISDLFVNKLSAQIPLHIKYEHTNNSQHGTGWVLVQGGVHDAGVSSLIVISHVFDNQTICVHVKPNNRITAKLDDFSSFVKVLSCFF